MLYIPLTVITVKCSNIYPTRCNVTQFIISGNCSTCFGWYLNPSSGAHTTVSTASDICHTVTATCRYRRGAQLLHDTSTHHQERIQLYLQHLVFVTPLLLPAAIVEELNSSTILPPIIRSAYNCIHSIWYLSQRYCYLPLSWRSSTPPRYFHPSSGAHNTASTASGICHTVTATCRYRGGAQLLHDTSTHHQERIQLHLQHLVFVTPLLLPAAIAAGSSNGLTNNRCCRYSCMRS